MAEDVRSGSSLRPKSSFLLSQETDQLPQTKPLFPAYANASAERSQPGEDDGKKNLNWLCNESYSIEALKFQPTAQVSVNVRKRTNSERDSDETEDKKPTFHVGTGKLASFTERDSSGTKRCHTQKHKHRKCINALSGSEDNGASTSTKSRNKKENLKNISEKTFIEEFSGLSPEDAFRVDRNADKDIWNYGCLYRLHIPKYIKGFSHNLGLAMGGKLGRFSGKHHSKKLNKDMGRYFSSESRKKMKSSCKVHNYKKHNGSNICKEAAPDHILLRKSEEQDQLSKTVDPHGIMDPSTVLYLQGRGGLSGDNKTVDEENIDPRSERVIYYNQRLQTEPHNIDLWLEFVQFQDQFLHSDSTEEKSQMTYNGVLEKKIAIFDKAIKLNSGSVDLHLARLKLYQETWEPERVHQTWKNLLFVHSGNADLWKTYLQFLQCSLGSLSITKITKSYCKCFKTIIGILDGKRETCLHGSDLDVGIFNIFVQYCQVLIQTGHTEKAVALFQALVEFNLFCPPALDQVSLEDRVTVFESFWDSGVSRFGEPGAKGWQYWVENTAATIEPLQPNVSTEESEEAIISKDEPQWKTWLDLESFRESVHFLPWRPDVSKDETEQSCEDLDRLVLCDDISPFLFRISNQKLHIKMLLQFLRILGVDCRGHLAGLCSQFALVDGSLLMGLKETQIGQLHESDQHESLVTFINAVFQQAICLFEGKEEQTALTVLWIQYSYFQKFKNGILSKKASKDIRKFAKCLLKEPQNRNNLIVWSEYAEQEWKLGKEADALKVLETALCIHGDVAISSNQAGLFCVYSLYVRIILGIKEEFNWTKCCGPSQSCWNKAQDTLLNLTEGCKLNSVVTPARLLKARKKMESLLTDILEEASDVVLHARTDQFYCTLEVVKCFALFEYCFSRELTPAVSLLESAIKKFEKKIMAGYFKSQLIDECHKFILMLTLYQMHSTSIPLTFFKDLLRKALVFSPHSPYFLSLLIKAEGHSYLIGKLRRYFSEALSKSASPVILVAAVQAELEHWTKTKEQFQSGISPDSVVAPNTGTVNRLRSIFERGLNYLSCQNCPLVWRLFLRFEHLFGSHERSRGVFYRALQHCPWAKALYKDGVAVLADSHLQEIVDLMMEKELRVQVPVEEVKILKGESKQVS